MTYKHIDKFCFYLSTLNMTSKQEKEILVQKLQENIVEIVSSHKNDQQELTEENHQCNQEQMIECQEIKLQQDMCRILINWLEAIQINEQQ